jgi:hypothetical protein
VRIGGWLFLVVGVACLIGGGVLGILAIQQATEISAYHHARACVAGAPANAECLRTVDGSVAAVTEFPGASRIPADYALDVRTASTALHLTFSSDSAMLSYAVDGDPAIVTMWRGVPVSVETDGRSEVTTSVPQSALAGDLGSCEKAAGLGAILVVVAWGFRRDRVGGGRDRLTRPVLEAALLALLLSGFVVAVGGWALGSNPSRIGPDLLATGAALVVVLGLSVWLGNSATRRAGKSPASPAHGHGIAETAPGPHTPPRHAAALARAARTPLRTRMHPANWARTLGARAAILIPVLLTAAVVFGIFLTTQDGPPARAFRHAPACVGESNLATCVGDFTAVINGVRAPANGANGADVSYVTADGAINRWVSFGGDTATVVREASADETGRTQLMIRVWRRSIIGAEFGGSFHWAWDNPPGNAVPCVFLAVSFALLLLMVRLRIHSRAASRAITQRLLVDDLGQVAAAAGSIVLLAYGFWAGAILAVVALAWLGWSARQSTQRARLTLAAPQLS